MKAAAQRAKTVRQYIVFHLKSMELLHLILLSLHLHESGEYPRNALGHGVDRFKETLLSVTVSTFVSLCDERSSTHSRKLWNELYPRHAGAIDRVWCRRIAPGEQIMKAYRDQAGAHGDVPHRYFGAKRDLYARYAAVLSALNSYLSLSTCLLRRQKNEIPELNAEIESALLEIELKWAPGQGSFNRKWLQKMLVIESGPYTKVYR